MATNISAFRAEKLDYESAKTGDTHGHENPGEEIKRNNKEQ
jgi:hypothetical protein